MLPPVSATSGSEISYGNLPAQQTTNGHGQSSAKVPTLSDQTSAASLIAKASLASLSSELQLTQNITVLADAIGKLLNLPKRDSETASAYASRLTSVINSMPAQQLAALEAKIAKILPGLTLTMLVETLRNPTGPQAARLALLLETAPHRGSDLATKAVVSSYRQNIGNETRAGFPSQPSQGETSIEGKLSIGPEQTAKLQSQSALRTAAPNIGTPIPAKLDQIPETKQSVSANQDSAIEAKIAATKTPSSVSHTVIQHERALPKSSVPTQASPSLAQPAALPTAPSLTDPAQRTATLSSAAQMSQTVQDTIKMSPEQQRVADLHRKFTPMDARVVGEKATFLGPPSNSNVQSAQDAEYPNAISTLISAITTANLPSQADNSHSLFASIFGMVRAVLKEPSLRTDNSTAPFSGSVDELTEQLAKLPAQEVQSRLIEALKYLPLDHPQIQALLIAILRNEYAVAQSYGFYPPADQDFEEESEARGSWGFGHQGQDDEGLADDEDHTQDSNEQGAESENNLAKEAEFDEMQYASEQHAESFYLKMGSFY